MKILIIYEKNKVTLTLKKTAAWICRKSSSALLSNKIHIKKKKEMPIKRLGNKTVN